MAMKISIFTSAIRNRAYSQALQLIHDDWSLRDLYNELLKKHWTRPEALEKVLMEMKHLRDEMAKLELF